MSVQDVVGRKAPPRARPLGPVPLAPGMWQVAGAGVTHPWDGAAYLLLPPTTPFPVLVDCGGPWSAGAVRSTVAGTATDPRTVRVVLATHRHADHVGGAETWVAGGARLLVGAADCPAVRAGDSVATTAGPLYAVTVPPLPCAVLEPGEVVPGVDGVPTPGHTPGSMCFLVRAGGRRVLVAGDTLWGGYDPDSDADLSAWRRSLDLLCSLEVDAFTFGHGVSWLVEDDVPRRLREARERFARFVDPWPVPPALDVRH